jgi:hypothetical protein
MSTVTEAVAVSAGKPVLPLSLRLKFSVSVPGWWSVLT